MRSKVIEGKAAMSYGNMLEVLEALEQLLEKQERFFATSVSLTTAQGKTLGHGELFDHEQSSVTSYL